MALNASIFGNMLNAPKSPEEYLAERQNLQASKLANALNQQKADEYTKGIARQGELRNLLAGGADVGALRRGGFLDEATKMETDALNARKGAAEASGKEFEIAQKRYDVYRKAAGARFNDPNLSKQSVLGDITQMQEMGILTPEVAQTLAAGLPDDPIELRKAVRQAAASQLTAEQMLTAFGPKPEKFDNGGQIITRDMNPNSPTYGQNTGGAPIVKVATPGDRLADARQREANQIKREEVAAGGKPPPGYRWNPDGSLTAIPGGPGDKLPESQQKQVVGVQNLSNAIQEYRQALKSFGTLDALNPDQRAMMGTKYNNMMLQAKEAYNLGVLNGPDFDILQSVVTDPRSLKGVITSNKALDTQASELDRIMSGVAQTSSQLKPRGGATQPSNQGPKAGDVDGGYRFKGGDPSNPSNWEKVK